MKAKRKRPSLETSTGREDPCRDRQATREESPRGGRQHRQARHDPGLAPPTGREEVRWLEEIGRPSIDAEVEELILRFAMENKTWGYDRVVGALAGLGHVVSDQTVGNVLERHGIPPAP